MYLTRYGTQFGTRTVRHGRTIYVAPSAQYSGIVSNISGGGGSSGTFGASDNNDGLSPERAVVSVTRAMALAVAGDTVILLPGTHTTTSIVTPPAGVSIFGAVGQGERDGRYQTEVTLTTSGQNHLINLKNSNVEIAYLRLRPIAGFSTVSFQTPASASGAYSATELVTGMYIHDCQIDMFAVGAIAGVLTAGIDFRKRAAAAGENYQQSVATVYGMIERCSFISGQAHGPGLALATCSVHIKDCRFHVASPGITWASPFIVATNTQGAIAESCIWTTTGTGLFGSNVSGAEAGTTLYALALINCRYSATGQITASSGVVVDNFATALTATQTECYQAGSGTAVTAIT